MGYAEPRVHFHRLVHAVTNRRLRKIKSSSTKRYVREPRETRSLKAVLRESHNFRADSKAAAIDRPWTCRRKAG